MDNAYVAASAAENAIKQANRNLNRTLWEGAADGWEPTQRARTITAQADALEKLRAAADALYTLECERAVLTAIEDVRRGQQWDLRAADPDAIVRVRERALRRARLSGADTRPADAIASLVVLVERTIDADPEP